MQRRTRSGAPPRIYPPSVVVEGAEIGADVVVGAFSFIAKGAVIGAGTRIQSHTSVWDGVHLGEDVFVGPAVQFTNVRYARAAFPRAPHWDRTIVENGATLGANATIVAPVRIGRYAVVGAGSVVTKDVPSRAMVAGNPARLIGWACECGAPLGRSIIKPEPGTRCAACGNLSD